MCWKDGFRRQFGDTQPESSGAFVNLAGQYDEYGSALGRDPVRLFDRHYRRLVFLDVAEDHPPGLPDDVVWSAAVPEFVHTVGDEPFPAKHRRAEVARSRIEPEDCGCVGHELV